jgi:hypothetical protein
MSAVEERIEAPAGPADPSRGRQADPSRVRPPGGVGARLRLLSAEPHGLVRLALGADALITGVNGVAYVAAAGLLDGPLGVEASTMRPIGAFLIAFAGLVGLLALARRPAPAAVRTVIAANVVWVGASLIVLAGGWLEPSTIGGIWIGLQAVVVGGFAALQAAALRHQPRGS